VRPAAALVIGPRTNPGGLVLLRVDGRVGQLAKAKLWLAKSRRYVASMLSLNVPFEPDLVCAERACQSTTVRGLAAFCLRFAWLFSRFRWPGCSAPFLSNRNMGSFKILVSC
jgi:hypothetical protein